MVWQASFVKLDTYYMKEYRFDKRLHNHNLLNMHLCLQGGVILDRYTNEIKSQGKELLEI